MKNIRVEDIEVPEEMFQVIYKTWLSDPAQWTGPRLKHAVALGLMHLAENPIVPSIEEANDVGTTASAITNYSSSSKHYTVEACIEWQRRMFLKREPELPEEVKVLHVTSYVAAAAIAPDGINKLIDRAYELGKKAGTK